MLKSISIKSSMEKPASHGGLINIGALIEATNLRDRLDRLANVHCVDPVFSHSEIILSMIGLISVGKPDCDVIEIFRSKPDFFMKALGLSGVPVQHCQKDTPEFIDSTLRYVRKITDQPVLMRLDSGNDSRDNFPDGAYGNVQFIIKRNLRRKSSQKWAEYQVDTYWCSIEQLDADEAISLYHDHGTSEQFHSELRSDMGLERLPSGRFCTNSLVLHLAMLACNMLRIIGQLNPFAQLAEKKYCRLRGNPF